MQLNDDGVIALSSVLNHNPRIEQLSLMCTCKYLKSFLFLTYPATGCEEFGAEALAASFADPNSNLSTLDLSGANALLLVILI